MVLWALFALAGFYYFFPGVVNWAKTVGRNTRGVSRGGQRPTVSRGRRSGKVHSRIPSGGARASALVRHPGQPWLEHVEHHARGDYRCLRDNSRDFLQERSDRAHVAVLLARAPDLLMQSYQMILTAAVMRRADSAERIEKVLAARAGLQKMSRPLIGTATSDWVMNVFNVRKQLEPGEGRIVNAARGAVASMPFAGWYITGFLLTGYTMWSAWQLYMYDEGGAFRGWSAVWIGALVLYAGFWLSFVLATGEYFLGWFSPASARSRRKLKKLRRRKKARASPNPERG